MPFPYLALALMTLRFAFVSLSRAVVYLRRPKLQTLVKRKSRIGEFPSKCFREWLPRAPSPLKTLTF
jgi:hypothetical protein